MLDILRLLIGFGIIGLLCLIMWKSTKIVDALLFERPIERSKKVADLYQIRYEADMAIRREMESASSVTRWFVKRELNKRRLGGER